MRISATVESTWEDGTPRTFRDTNGGLWRVAIDAADGTLAVEEICDYGGGPAIATVDEAETAGCQPCGVARWGGEGVEIYRCSHGENHTDPSAYGVNCADEFVATPSGWERRTTDE